MELLVIMSMVVASTLGYAPLREPGSNAYNDATFIQDLMERINRDMEPDTTYMDFGNKMDGSSSIPLSFVPGRSTKDSEFFDENDYDLLMGTSGLDKSIRVPEYLEHSSLYGHKLMSGGSGEPGSLKVKGQKVPTEVKSDAVLPAYCNPPNPCPVGHTADEGCLEIFENTAAFSRAYQASQDCMCDTEHMFDCHASSSSQEADDESDLTIGQSPFLSELQQVDGEHKRVVAKKFYNKKAPEQTLSRLNVMARNAAAVAHDSGIKLDENPYLQGEKLPIAAKKGHHAL